VYNYHLFFILSIRINQITWCLPNQRSITIRCSLKRSIVAVVDHTTRCEQLIATVGYRRSCNARELWQKVHESSWVVLYLMKRGLHMTCISSMALEYCKPVVY